MSVIHEQLEGSVAIERRKDAEIIPAHIDPTTPMGLIALAAQRGATIEQMAQLFELQLRVEAVDARKAFNTAMAKFKANPPRITKNVQKKAGPIELNYASLDHICDAVIPALSAVGVRHSWRTEQSNGQMTVTCIISHEAGHTEETPLSGPYDTSGGKNPIQAIASAKTYLERYTLLAAVGMAAGGMDDDGRGTGKEPETGLDDGEYDRMIGLIDAADTLPLLQKTFVECFKAARAANDQGAMAGITKAKEARKAQLQ